jgi:hypothetical protein
LHICERHFALAPAFKGNGLQEMGRGDGFALHPFGLATRATFFVSIE